MSLGLGFGTQVFDCGSVEGCCARVSCQICQIVCRCLASHIACCSSETLGAARAHKADESMVKTHGGGDESALDPYVLCLEDKLQRRVVQTHIQPMAHLVDLVCQELCRSSALHLAE